MDMHDLKKKSVIELEQMLAESHDQLRDLRFQAGAMQLKEVSKIKTLRRDIARMQTALKQLKTS